MKKYLIIGPAWIGDMVMAQGLFTLLKKQQPDAQLDVIAPDWTRPLLDRMPEVDNVLSLPFKHGEFSVKHRWELGKSLRSEYYDEAIVLPNSWKSAIVPFAAHIPKRTGWVGEMRYGLLNNARRLNKKRYPLMIERFMALGLSTSTKHSPDAKIEITAIKPKLIINIENRTKPLEKYHLNLDKPIVALCPGAEFGYSKRWPENYYAQVANYFLEKNFHVWLMGSQKDKTVTDQINLATKQRCENLAGQTNLSEAIDLLSLASFVFTNDSGLMHITAALDKPLIALYGSTDPGFTPPLSDKAKILSIELSCRPCFKRECPLKHHRCMRDLLPSHVLEVYSKQLDFEQGANEASNRSVQIVHEDCERVCNTAQNSSAKSIE